MDNIFELMIVAQQKQEMGKILEYNSKSERFGLSLSEEAARMLLISRKSILTEHQRVEFREGVLPKLIEAFCDSQYINQDNYVDILTELQDMFYLYKNESLDELTDDELITFMRKQFESVCFGDLEYLRDTCMERFARATRSGDLSKMQSRLRDEYSLRDPEDEYSDLMEETRWDRNVYKTKLEDLF